MPLKYFNLSTGNHSTFIVYLKLTAPLRLLVAQPANQGVSGASIILFPGQLTAECILTTHQECRMPTLNRPARALRNERIVDDASVTYGTCPAKGCWWAR